MDLIPQQDICKLKKDFSAYAKGDSKRMEKGEPSW